ncbi:MAG: hypothetical protein DCC75_10610, partial [Proteobacteria bacterium]
VEAAGGRLVVYFGARHWRWDQDAAISQATFNAGVATSSTAAGASLVSRRPVGTIPHVLENVLAWRYGKERAVVESTKAFDREIDPEIKRIALIDYNNREIDDSLAVAEELGERLYGVRVDTCGENMAQGALTSPEDPKAAEWRAQGLFLPEASHRHAKYWYGSGVTITGVFALRRALDSAGFKNVQIILTSGFGDQQKVLAFREAERLLGIKLFESLGVGGFYESRAAKMDIVMVGEDRNSLTPISKAGRGLKPNPAMKLRLGEEPDNLC